MLTTYCFTLPTVGCANCAFSLETALTDCKTLRIESFLVDIIKRDDKSEGKLTVIVSGDDYSPTETRRLLHDVLNQVCMEFIDIDLPSTSQPRSHWLLGFIGTATGIALLMLSLVSGALPLAAMLSIAAISVPLTLFLGAESYIDTVRFFKTRVLTMDTLFAISTLTAMIVSVAAFFIPWLPMMFDAGLLIFGFRHIGLGIEQSINHAMGLGLTFSDRLPRTVDGVTDGVSEKRSLETITPGDALAIDPGKIIPVDGVCDSEGCSIFDTIVTGSTLPRDIRLGERLLAGMSVAGTQSLRLRATALANQSYLARLDQTIENARHVKAPLETSTSRLLQYFIPTVFIFAIASALVIGHFFTVALAIQSAVSVLVSACPCTLGFITPLAVKIGMNKAADHGVRFQSAKKLQDAEQIDTVVFDLNGTLTLGTPVVRTYGVMPGVTSTEQDVLAYFSVLEKQSNHPMAKAIYKFVNEKNSVPPIEWQVTSLDQSNHSGLTALINEEPYTLGNETMMREAGIDVQHVDSHRKEGDTVIYLARGTQVMGYMVLADQLRPTARSVIDALKTQGKTIYLCTGSDETTAHRYADELGILRSNVHAGCMGSAVEPSDRDKKTVIDTLKASGRRVAMVGDAANDALAITASQLGIAVKSQGSDELTQENAGVVIQSGSLWPIVSAFEVAKQTVNNVKQNLLLSLGYNIGAMLVASGVLLAFGVVLSPAVGVALMIIQTSLLLCNAYRFKQQTIAHTPSADAPFVSSYSRFMTNRPSSDKQPQVTPAIAELPDTLFKPKADLTMNRDADSPSIFNGMRLTNADA